MKSKKYDGDIVQEKDIFRLYLFIYLILIYFEYFFLYIYKNIYKFDNVYFGIIMSSLKCQINN
jgi:hypothetical protein